MKKRILLLSTLILAIIVAIGISILFYYGRVDQHIILNKTSFSMLHDWQQDNHSQALIAFQQSCHEILTRDPEVKFSPLLQSGTVQQWQTICAEALKITHPTQAIAQQFFEEYF